MPVVELVDARKRYRSLRRPEQRALDGLDVVIEAGGIVGFLGPNGAGKTTTIRVLLGLVRLDKGEARILGARVPAELPRVIGRIGALVEQPTFFPAFTGRRNLELLAGVAGVPRPRVDEVLDIVRLRDRAGDRYKGYSLGMKQRLGIAAALLKDPELLLLDEPTNGLDPAGIREVRGLLKELGQSRTVVVSSHLLAEVQQTCDRVVIVAKGRLVSSGSVADVVAASTSSTEVRVRLADLDAGHRVLSEAGYAVARRDGALVVATPENPAEITKVLARKRLYVSELTPVTADLEDVFLQLTGEPA